MQEIETLPKCKDSERSVGFVTRVTTQVASPEVIGPDVVQGCRWFQVLQQKCKVRLMPATPTPNLNLCRMSTCWYSKTNCIKWMHLAAQGGNIPVIATVSVTLKYLVVDDCFRIIKHELPVIAVDEAQECHQGNCELGLGRSKIWQGYMAIPINFRQCHDAPALWSFCNRRRSAGRQKNHINCYYLDCGL